MCFLCRFFSFWKIDERKYHWNSRIFCENLLHLDKKKSLYHIIEKSKERNRIEIDIRKIKYNAEVQQEGKKFNELINGEIRSVFSVRGLLVYCSCTDKWAAMRSPVRREKKSKRKTKYFVQMCIFCWFFLLEIRWKKIS